MRVLVTLPLFLVACGGGAASTHADMARPPDYGSSSDLATLPDGGTVYPDGIDPAQAKALEALLDVAAKEPLTCAVEATLASGSKATGADLAFTVVVMPADLGMPYGDATRDRSVLFSTTSKLTNPDDASMPIDPSQSLLVAYIPTVEPELTLSGSTYLYRFHGEIIDQLQLTGADDHVSAVTFTELDGQGAVYYRASCTAP